MRSDFLQPSLTAQPRFASAYFGDGHDAEAPVHTLRADKAPPMAAVSGDASLACVGDSISPAAPVVASLRYAP